MKTLSTFVFAFLMFVFCDIFCIMPATYALSIDFVHIGNAGNAGELSGGSGYLSPEVIVGAVDYEYAIGKTEVTNAQYVEFLNAVAKTDSYNLHSSLWESSGGITQSGTSGNYYYSVKADVGNYVYANRPVIYASWYDAVRFTNWLHNGQGTGDTETGAYTLLGGTPIPSNWESITRNADAQFWIPSEDEWYKAAYHDASAGTAAVYFDYATGTDIAPDNNPPAAGSGNSVNYDYARGSSAYYHTAVGAYVLSTSSYGTYDQNGNVLEWNEDYISTSAIGLISRSLRGGSFLSRIPSSLSASHRSLGLVSSEAPFIGFRVATVPEPSSLLLGMLAAAGLLVRRRSLG